MSNAGYYQFIPFSADYLYKVWGETWQEVRHNIRQFDWYKQCGIWIDCGGIEENGDKYLIVGPLYKSADHRIKQKIEDLKNEN